MMLYFHDQCHALVQNLISSFLSSIQGNQPLARKLRGDMATREYAALIAHNFPLLSKLENVQDDLDQEVSVNDHIIKFPMP